MVKLSCSSFLCLTFFFSSLWTPSFSFLQVYPSKKSFSDQAFLTLEISKTSSSSTGMLLQKRDNWRWFSIRNSFKLSSTSSNLHTDTTEVDTSGVESPVQVPSEKEKDDENEGNSKGDEDDESVSNEPEEIVLQVGDRLPIDATFQVLKNGKPADILATDIFVGKKVILIGVAGAFTPTCTNKHIPPYLEKAQEFRDQKGIDQIIIVSVNDCFVMDRWRQELGIEEYQDNEDSSLIEDRDKKIEILVLADGGGNFARKTGFYFDTGRFGGSRMQRMSAVVVDGVVKMLHLEGGGKLEDSAAEVLMAEL